MSSDDAFVAEHEPMVRSIALRVRVELELDTDVRDLVSDGMIGLLEARARFDPARGIPFGAFAHHRVRGAILDGVRRLGRLPRRTHDQLKRLVAANRAHQDATDAARDEAPPSPDVDSMAAAVDALFGKVTAAFVATALAQEAQRGPEEAVITELEKARVRRVLGALPAKEQRVVRGIYFDERMHDELATELGLTRSAVSKIHARGLGMMRDGFG